MNTKLEDYLIEMFKPGSNHVMVDCETMSTAGNAAVLQIGAVRFNHDTLDDEFEISIQLQDLMDDGHHISASTIMWWLKQGDDARAALIKGQEDAVKIVHALHEFTAFLKSDEIDDESQPKIWGNDPSADNRWIMELYEKADMPLPWKYYNNRCYRTFCATHNHSNIQRPEATVKHSALGDAKAQAMHMIEILNY